MTNIVISEIESDKLDLMLDTMLNYYLDNRVCNKHIDRLKEDFLKIVSSKLNNNKRKLEWWDIQ